MRVSDDLKLIARQLRMKSGDQRLDLLLSGGKDLCLVELKITAFAKENLDQVISYKDELKELQQNGKLVNA